MPSRPILQAWAKKVGPSPSICSLNRMPGLDLATIDASVVAPYHRRLEAENAVRKHRLQRGARVVRTSSSNLDLRMRRPRLLGIFLLAAALMSTGAEFAVARSADEDDVSVPLEWKNQIIADLEHNKRYLPRIRTRGRSGVVRFEFNMSRSGWVLPGTRIVTINPELGRAALLLIQQSQPFSPPDHVKLPDAS